jgi:hypothetical protein
MLNPMCFEQSSKESTGTLFSHFVDESPSIAEGGEGIGVSGCPAKSKSELCCNFSPLFARLSGPTAHTAN